MLGDHHRNDIRIISIEPSDPPSQVLAKLEETVGRLSNDLVGERARGEVKLPLGQIALQQYIPITTRFGGLTAEGLGDVVGVSIDFN